ncbi:uncharacterized protein PHALS_04690 [Plasmopara halstedii]|uniref:Uncharacterized protein n=1 Tax=Plasmopara halstedii TaxID=4781 RepID=A0A0P1A928_PLAHL|nr:uncharacterized protein PHALS_04690 [Plasmopara halstedii]CEG37249.1 hypothetical protein PHALS_04690 [Plasmopara halstedii]|eukprot:XP_024573618.1 hypothetical protein PHALS_04690 [Plasmopara halstedii]
MEELFTAFFPAKYELCQRSLFSAFKQGDVEDGRSKSWLGSHPAVPNLGLDAGGCASEA